MSESNTSPEIPPLTGYNLPKVTKEVTDSLFADVQEQGIKSTMKLATDRFSTNNPQLYESMGSFAFGLLGNDADPRTINIVHDVMVMTHELLRRQAESDALDQHLATPIK